MKRHQLKRFVERTAIKRHLFESRLYVEALAIGDSRHSYSRQYVTPLEGQVAAPYWDVVGELSINRLGQRLDCHRQRRADR